MSNPQRLTDGEIKAVADRVLGPEMADLGFAGVDVEYREVYDDGPSLYISARVGGEVPSPFDPDRYDRFRQLLVDALFARGEERFPYMLLRREGDERSEPEPISVDP